MKKHFLRIMITLLIGAVGVTHSQEFNVAKKSNHSPMHIDPIHPTKKIR